MKKLALITAVFALVVFAGLSVNAQEKRPHGVAPGASAPAFTLKDQDGKDVSLKDFAGKIVVLEWTNPECPFVKAHYGTVTTMIDLANKYKDNGVVWLAINSTSHFTVAKNKEWAAEKKIPFAILDDHEGTVGHAYGAKTTPHMYIIGKDGKILYVGAIDDNPLAKKPKTHNHVATALDEILAGKTVTTAETTPYGCSVKYAK